MKTRSELLARVLELEQEAADRKLLRELERENTPSLRKLLEENGYIVVKRSE